jgi:hypothetical protein
MKLVCVGLLLVMCQPVDEPAPARVTVAVCPVTAPWSAHYQKRRAAALRARPPGSAIEDAIAEPLSLRHHARACEEVHRAEGSGR